MGSLYATLAISGALGTVLFASSILSAGVYAAGRPFTATVGQLAGMVVTVVGLFAFLRIGA